MVPIIVLLGIMTLGCTHEKSQIAEPTIPAAPALVSFLEIKTLRIVKGGQTKTVLYGNGLLEDNGEPLGRIHRDGRFVDLLGRVLVTMSSDGHIVLPRGDIHITPDGTIWTQLTLVPREELQIDSTGRVHGVTQDIHIEGISDELRRTAAYALILPDILRLNQTPEVH